MDLTMIRRASWRVSAGLMLSAAVSVPAFAQTIQLTDSNDTVIRGGTYANTNFSRDLILVTRASDDDTYERRSLLKFDTQNTIPANAQISSAKLTVTVAGGNSQSRTLSASPPPTTSGRRARAHPGGRGACKARIRSR